MLDAVCSVLGLQYSQILNSTALHNENKEVKLKLDSVLNVTRRSLRRLSGYAASGFSIPDVSHVVTAVWSAGFAIEFLLGPRSARFGDQWMHQEGQELRVCRSLDRRHCSKKSKGAVTLPVCLYLRSYCCRLHWGLEKKQYDTCSCNSGTDVSFSFLPHTAAAVVLMPAPGNVLSHEHLFASSFQTTPRRGVAPKWRGRGCVSLSAFHLSLFF